MANTKSRPGEGSERMKQILKEGRRLMSYMELYNMRRGRDRRNYCHLMDKWLSDLPWTQYEKDIYWSFVEPNPSRNHNP